MGCGVATSRASKRALSVLVALALALAPHRRRCPKLAHDDHNRTHNCVEGKSTNLAGEVDLNGLDANVLRTRSHLGAVALYVLGGGLGVEEGTERFRRGTNSHKR